MNAGVGRLDMELLRELGSSLWQFATVNTPTAVAALFGTFFGAWFAFLFERKHQETIALEADLAAGRQAQFALIAHINTMTNIRTQYLEPQEKDPHRHLKLVPFQVRPDFPRMPVTSLGYFLEDAEGANILSEALVAENRFFEFLAGLEERNTRHETMQHAIARLGPEKAIDPATEGILKGLTDSLYGLSAAVIKGHNKSLNDIRGLLRKRFPGKTTLGLKELP